MDGSQCYGVSKSLRGIRFGARSVPTFTKNNIEGPSVCPYGISKGYELSPADIDVVETDMGLVLSLFFSAEEIVNNWGNSSLVQLSGLLFSFLESLVDRLRNYGEIFVFF
ncbi:hypothetical protein V6N13_134652 [Hibiscus sabdariffa]